MIESGVKDFVVDTWLGFGAPAGLPQPLVTRLNAELNRITNLPEMRKKFVEQGIIRLAGALARGGAEVPAPGHGLLAAHHQGLGGDGGVIPYLPTRSGGGVAL